MAQHIKIENWKKEKWYPKVMKRIKWLLKYSSGNKSSYGLERYLKRVKILPSDYCTDVYGNKEGNLALDYKTKLNDMLDKENNYRLADCGIEIHSKSRGFTQNKLIQAYIVL
jgi:hypothetical protein|tara:strand:+ start:368 stop:703 length:336 start_codon:yes stop_codon:yes gene_type:complete